MNQLSDKRLRMLTCKNLLQCCFSGRRRPAKNMYLSFKPLICWLKACSENIGLLLPVTNHHYQNLQIYKEKICMALKHVQKCNRFEWDNGSLSSLGTNPLLIGERLLFSKCQSPLPTNRKMVDIKLDIQQITTNN